ncbi:O-antigen ligase family protein [Sodalis sp. C49]|uniref:O-antigen ligase family protein n=1 Tax=Sodalis sp. C49 TaxID=3228929 RepID=UPI003965A971
MKTFFRIIVLLSFSFCVTNYVPVSTAIILTFPLAFLGLCYRNEGTNLKKIEVSIIALFSYVIISTLCYNPESFMEFDFYRRDGNFIISYLVLFIFIFTPVKIIFDIKKLINLTFPFFIVISAIGAVVVPPEAGGDASVRHFFFESHNAAGGFYSVVASIAVGFFLKERKLKYLIYSVVFLAFLWMTNSRGSILAIMFAIGYSFIKFKKSSFVFVLFVALQIGIVMTTYPDWLQMGKVMSASSNTDANVNVAFARASTYIDRLYFLWPRAFDNFLHSPLFGMGFGSFDDLFYKYVDIIPHVWSVKENAIIAHTASHAHNSLLMILAELGIVGLVLYIYLFNQLNKEIKRIQLHDSSAGLALALAFWSCIFSAATEHRITTPSQMLPFFLYFGICYMNYRNRPQLNERERIKLILEQ